MIIGIDLDGTIADFSSLAIENANKIFGLELKYDDMLDMKFATQVRKEIGPLFEQYSDDESVYNAVCDKDFFYRIKPYPNAIEAVRQLAQEHQIIFITKPLEYEHSPNSKFKWLEKYFGDIEYTIIFVQDTADKRLVAVDILIDDDPRALRDCKLSTPICVSQPWNREFREKEFAGYIVSDFAAVIDIINYIAEYFTGNFESSIHETATY